LSPVVILKSEKLRGKENLNVVRRIILNLERRSNKEKRKKKEAAYKQLTTNNKNDVL